MGDPIAYDDPAPPTLYQEIRWLMDSHPGGYVSKAKLESILARHPDYQERHRNDDCGELEP